MFVFIFGSRFTQTFMLRICSGLVLAGLTVAAHKAQSEEGSFAPDLEILTIQPTRSGTGWLIPYRLKANFPLNQSADVVSTDAAPDNMPKLHLVAEPKKPASWPTSSGWQTAPGNDRAILSPILRFESKGERLEIKPYRRSLWVVWRQSLH